MYHDGRVDDLDARSGCSNQNLKEFVSETTLSDVIFLLVSKVLRAALKGKYDLDLPNVLAQRVSQLGDVTEIEGFICNKSAHWFAIRNINGRFWNLNSMEERPKVISHFKLATEIAGYQSSGYTVFCVREGLPPACTTESQRKRGLPQYWWKEKDLVSGKGRDAVTAATDPWRNVGSGMRLDGGSTSTNTNVIEGLTEEEMIQMALTASLEPTAAMAAEQNVTLTPEPPKGTPNVASIQFRFPNGTRSVRRFLKTDSVGMVYAYVESESKDGQVRRIELRAGFPPKDLQSVRTKTIGEANLSGEAIQCRFV
jgi:ataxin-3